MTHSLDTFITDSANSASALNTGHKSSSGALGVYADSSADPFDDPKVETIAEIFQRLWGGHVGIVSTAYIADATPAAINAHTRERGTYEQIVDMMLNGNTNYTWSEWNSADVIFGGGAEQFYNSTKGGSTYLDKDYYLEFENAGYNVVLDKDALEEAANDTKTLGIFSTSNMAKWLDRNVSFLPWLAVVSVTARRRTLSASLTLSTPGLYCQFEPVPEPDRRRNSSAQPARSQGDDSQGH